MENLRTPQKKKISELSTGQRQQKKDSNSSDSLSNSPSDLQNPQDLYQMQEAQLQQPVLQNIIEEETEEQQIENDKQTHQIQIKPGSDQSEIFSGKSQDKFKKSRKSKKSLSIFSLDQEQNKDNDKGSREQDMNFSIVDDKSDCQSSRQLFTQRKKQSHELSSNNLIMQSSSNLQSSRNINLIEKRASDEKLDQIESESELKIQNDPSHDVPIKNSKRSPYFILLFIIPLLLIIIGIIVGFIIAGSEDSVACKGLNRDSKNDCKCKHKYFELDGKQDCSGPYENTILSAEDIETSLIGQRSTIMPRIHKKEGVELFQYSIQNLQHSHIDGKKITNQTDILHNIGVLTTDITDETFECLLFFSNTTYTQGSQVDFIDGFPGQDFWDNVYNQYPNKNDKKAYDDFFEAYQKQQQENKQKDQDQSDKDDDNDDRYGRQTLNMFEEALRKSENITVQRYLDSFFPLMEFKLSKNTGTATNLVYPINFPKYLKEVITSFLNQYAPPINPQFFSAITKTDLEEDGNGRRRLRTLTETQEVENSQGGYFETEHPEYQADVNTEENTASMTKQYDSSTDSKSGTVVQQDSKFNQATVMRQGQIEKSTVESEMNLSNNGNDDVDDSNYSEDYQYNPDQKPAQPTESLFEDMKIEQTSNLAKVAYSVIPKAFTTNMQEVLSKNHLRKQTFTEFQEEMIEEKIQLNGMYNEVDNNLDGELDGQLDDEEEEYGVRGRLLRPKRPSRPSSPSKPRGGNGKVRELIKKFVFKMFQFDLLGIQVKGYGSFRCTEGRAGQRKDDCYMGPQFAIGAIQIPALELHMKAAIAKYVRQFNWFRHNIFERAINIINVLETNINYISSNASDIVNITVNMLDPDLNPITAPIKNTTDSFNDLIDSTYGEFNGLIQTSLDILVEDFIQPVKEINDNIKFFVFGQLNNLDFLWDNLDLSLLSNLEEYDEFLDEQTEISSSICIFIDNTNTQFTQFTNEKIQDTNDFVENMYATKIVQPVTDLIQQLIFRDEEALTLEEFQDEAENFIDDPKIEIVSGIFKRLSKTLFASFIQRPINVILEEVERYIENYQQNLSSKVLRITGQVSDKISDLSSKCKQKAVQGLQLSHATQTKTNQLLQIDTFIDSLQIFDSQPDDEESDSEEFTIVTLIPANFVTYFKNKFEEKKNRLFQLKDDFVSFGKGFKSTLTSGIKDVIGNVKNLTKNMKTGLVGTSKEMKTKIKNLITTLKNLVPELRAAVKNGNKDNKEYLDEAVDIDSIKSQIESILDFKLPIKETQKTIEQLMDVPNQFTKMEDWIKSLAKNPFERFALLDFELPQIDFIDKDDIQNVFGEIVNEQVTNVDTSLEEDLEQDLKVGTVATYAQNIEEPKNDLLDRIQESVFDQMGDLDDIFIEQLKQIMMNFEIEKKRIYSRSLFKKEIEKMFQYPTPIGIAFFISFGLNAEVAVHVDFGIKGREVKLSASLQAFAEIEAQGGVSFYIVKAGAYVTALLFNGILAVHVAIGFAGAMYGLILVDATINAFEVRAGLFASYLWFRMGTVCVDLGCGEVCVPFPEFYWADNVDLIKPFIFGGLSKYFEILRIDI